MKKLALIAAMAAASLSTNALAKDVVVGATMSKFADKWLTYLIDGAKQFDNEHDDLKIIFTDANDDPARMVNDVENFIDQGVNAVIIHPTDRQIVRTIAKKLKKANIPLIVVNRQPHADDMSSVDAYIGSEEIVGGKLQGEEIIRLLDGKEGRVGILMGPLGLEGQIQRTAGNEEAFKGHDNIKVISKQEGKWDRDKGMAITEDWLQSKDNINVIVANNDEMAIGALLATRKAGIKDEDMIIVGLDATPDALTYLGEGLDATVFQDGHGQGYGGAQLAYKLAKGEKVEHVTWVPFQLVTPKNKAEFENAQKK